MTAPIPFIDLAAQRRRIGPSLDERIGRVLDHGQYILGPEVHELEQALATRCGAAHAVSCGSGTEALLLVLLERGVRPGDAVILPSFTFTATAEVIVLLGATPVFVDVDERTFCVDPHAIPTAAATARGRGLDPKAVIAVDLYGQPADYSEVCLQAAAEGLWVLADSAQSFGAFYRDRAVGTLAEATATSFFPSKPLGCYGDGGAVFTQNGDVAEVLRSLREHGRGARRYDTRRIGINGRLDTVQAAVLLEKLQVFDDELACRQSVAKRYEALLAEVVSVPVLAPDRDSTWAQYTIRVAERDRVAERLAEEGIPTAVHYPIPLHRQPAFAGRSLETSELPVTDQLAAEVLCLPMHPYLDEAVQERITDAIRRAVGGS